ncbi:RNA polymerase sigma factor [Microlunatus antarcticus]|uniref:RNA polymerase sigma factor (Sigma-70 family) n=1 Tax=Microlunatus antarcticus TaxID=53388 RepID=A0A7W5JSQ7_9ACTN|nr:RNA polymerase sigma factor (sigma-70 family) [Microlunatus antarcticus]
MVVVTGGAVEDSLAVRAGRMFAAYRAGDGSAMGDLVRTLTPLLWHTVRATRLDAAAAEDVLQTVWLSLVRHGDTILEPNAVLQWLVVSAKREAWRVSRGQDKVRPEDVETTRASETDGAPEVGEQVAGAEADDVLWRHVQQLPERCQTLLRVIAFATKPDYAQIARALGMPVGSIGPTRGRCLAKLRLALAADPQWGAA